MLAMDRRKSVIHALRVFLTNPITIYPSRTTQKYLIGYEPKVYRIHQLTYKISKELVNNSIQNVNIQTAVDINVREDYRFSIHFPIEHKIPEMKTVVVRVIPTRYNDYEPIYGIFYQFKTRKTGAGGRDELIFNIPECPIISTFYSIPNTCYKLISEQMSATGSHGINTYIILAKNHGEYNVGKWKKVTNINNGGHQHMYTKDVILKL